MVIESTVCRKRSIAGLAAGAIIGAMAYLLLELGGPALRLPVVGIYMAGISAAGLLFARYLDHHDELEHRKATQEILEEVTLTVVHYIRNSNSVIGGQSRRLIEHRAVAGQTRTTLEMIREASDRIEAVVSSLQSLDADVRIETVGTTRLRMLDIRELVQQRMQQFESTLRPVEPGDNLAR